MDSNLELRRTLLSVGFLLALVPACLASFVPCEPCDHKALSLCPPVPVSCQVLKEPGCGCCLTCALREGHACGVYTGTCAEGLRCLPRAGEDKPLHALLHGKGVCTQEKNPYKLHRGQGSQDDVLTEDILSHHKVLLFPQDHINNKKVLALHEAKRRLQSKLRIGGHTDYPIRSMNKPHQEIGQCRRELDVIIRRMKGMSRVNSLSLYIPNCDKKGFFKRKQCKPSSGRKRGICWCVDKYGVMMPGTDYTGGDIQCKDAENNSNNNE